MGTFAMIISSVLFIRAGICWERQKYVKLTKTGLKIEAIVDVMAGIYFIVAAIGMYSDI